MRKVVSILLIKTCFLLSPAAAQQWEIGGNLGAAGYMGDINPSNPFYFKSVGGGLHAKYNFNPTWGIKAFGAINRLYGSDENSSNPQQVNRNLMFRNLIKELSLVAEFNFFRFIAGRDMNKYTPYLFAGIGAIHHDPYLRLREGKRYLRAEPSKDDIELENDGNGASVTYGNFAAAIPFGAGFKYNVKGAWSIGAELMYRTTLTNHIDNVSGYYKDNLPSDYRSYIHDIREPGFRKELRDAYLADPYIDSPHTEGSRRGTGNRFDGFMTASVTLTYTFVSQKCYWW